MEIRIHKVAALHHWCSCERMSTAYWCKLGSLDLHVHTDRGRLFVVVLIFLEIFHIFVSEYAWPANMEARMLVPQAPEFLMFR
jgi:hypothetical protein